MIVLVSNREDFTTDRLVAELQRRDAEFSRLNTEDIPTRVRLKWTPRGAEIQTPTARVTSREATAVWWRRPVPPRMPEHYGSAEGVWAADESQAAMDGFWHSLHAHWVNRPQANADSSSKPEQLQRARRFDLHVPDTIITNDPEAAEAFVQSHGAVVTKSIYNGVVPVEDQARVFYTERLGEDDIAAIRSIGPEPCLLQSMIDKAFDVRVTVIGDHAYPCRIDSRRLPPARIDWRKADVTKLQHTPCAIPPALADACVRLTHSYGLRFSAIDLACDVDGNYTFFEINSNGQWAWIEQLAGIPLTARLADELLQPPRRSA